MNTRIQELAEQAGLIPGIMGLNRFTYFDPEKFAQLIAMECATVCDALQDVPATEPRHCADDIRTHFGLEQ